MKKLQRVLIVAGGTGGHVFPGLAVAHALQTQGTDVQWLGTPTGIEAKLIPAAQIPITYIPVRGLRGMGWQRWFRAPIDLYKAIIRACQLLRDFKPDVVLGMGGFAAGPAGVACYLMRIPLVIHEQNSIGGFTNRVLSHWAKKVLLGLPQAKHPHALKSQNITGNPVRHELLKIKSPAERFSEKSGELHLLILGGSQGALALNQLLPQALAKVNMDKIVGKKIQVWHQTGERYLQQTQQAYTNINVSVRVMPFINDMAEAYIWADIVICRAGALTISELAAVGMGALLIPFPGAIDDHQSYNAAFLVHLGGAQLLPQNTLTPEQLAAKIEELCHNRDVLRQMALASYQGRFPNATESIVKALSDEKLYE